MSVQSTPEAGRSLWAELLHWALPRLAIYVFGSLAVVAAFLIWAAFYTYVWPGKPPAIETPRPAPNTLVPTEVPLPLPRATPDENSPAIVQKVPQSPPTLQEDPPVLPSLRNADIYDPSNAKVGQIKDVLVSYDGKLVGYIVGVGESFLGGQAKDIAVPPQAVRFTTKDGRTFTFLYMTKDAVKSAPKQKFDNYKMRWVPDTTP